MASAPVVSSPSSLLPLRVEGLVKRFGELTAVNGITLGLKSGECLGLLGPNGAGKSTLIRSIVGRVIPDAGRCRCLATCRLDWRTHGPGMGSARPCALRKLTCRENLESFGQYHGLRGAALKTAVDWCLDWAALTDRALEPVQHLSGGMKRRLNMAAGLIHRPKVILMDEPTVGVDPQSRNRIFEMIETLRGEGISLIYTTHYMEEAERLCDRIAIIDHGRIIALGTRDELVQKSFASRSEVLARFVKADDAVAAWVKERGGRYENGMAQFTIEHATEIAGMLEAATRRVTNWQTSRCANRTSNPYSCNLTGRELRD